MTQPFDEQLRQTFDSLAEGLRITLSERLTVAADQLAGAVESERHLAAVQAAREAAAAAERDVASRLNAAFAVREAHIREAVHVGSFDAGLQQARAEAEAREEAREAEARSRAEAAQQAVAEHSAALAAAQAAADAALAEADAAKREAVAAKREADAAKAEAGAARAEADAATIDAAAANATANAVQTAADAARNTAAARIDPASIDRLLQDVRSLDAATSLSQALDALAAAARAEADRVAIFLVRSDTLRAWSHVGFEGISTTPIFEVSVAHAGVAADAVRSGLSQRIAATADRRPAFAGAATTGVFVAVPLVMNSQVIGLLCGEQLSTGDQGQWLATTYEILARHAARVLESRTALRLAQLGSHPVATSPVSPPLPT